jgi:hypothetical protein
MPPGTIANNRDRGLRPGDLRRFSTPSAHRLHISP